MLSLHELQENIALRLNYSFLATIQDKMPYNNAYFLVCLAEVIYEVDNDNSGEILNEENIFEVCIEKAAKIYETTNISAYLSQQ